MTALLKQKKSVTIIDPNMAYDHLADDSSESIAKPAKVQEQTHSDDTD